MAGLKRGEGKFNSDIGLVDGHKFYKEKYGKIDKTLYKSVLYDFNDRMIEDMMLKNQWFNLPARLGQLGIIKRKTKFKIKEGRVVGPLDYKRCWDMWRKDYPDLTDQEIADLKGKNLYFHENKHSRKYIASFYWDKKISNVRNQIYFRFKPIRANKRQLAKLFKDDDFDVDFLELTDL